MPDILTVSNGEAFDRSAVPDLSTDGFRTALLDRVADGQRVAALFGRREGAGVRRYAVLADDPQAALQVFSTAGADAFPALTPECPQVHLFEREIHEQTGARPEGHPWLKPVRFHAPAAPGAARPLPGVTDFFRMAGEGVHEVAVGPVHAGIIEPGHFRFQCHGETVHHLEIALGYQHRGVEAALAGGPNRRTLPYLETLAGDTTIGHTLAYAQAAEALAGVRVPARAHALRAIALELERLANHTGDLGALANDVGFLPTAAYCGRLRGDFLNMSALLCGNRFGRGLVRPGGAGFDLDEARARDLLARLAAARADTAAAAKLLWETPTVLARFEGTGVLARATCEQMGLVGPAARAAGIERDVRRDFPAGLFQFTHLPVATWHTGDVFARAYVRWLEIEASADFVREQATMLPDGGVRNEAGRLRADGMVVSLAEGWRGEICHVALTGADGAFAHYKVVDPSFHNWTGLALALRGQQISDFPLCNKSFNLSYCGHDL